METETASMLATRLRRAHATRTPVGGVKDAILALAGSANPLDVAYEIAGLTVAHGIASGARVAGRAIGLTNRAVQQQFGVDQPIYGTLFAQAAVFSGGQVVTADLIQPLIGAEIGFVLKRDLDRDRHTVVDLLGAIDFVVPAIGVVDSAIVAGEAGLLDTVADNASLAHFAVGARPVAIGAFDPAGCGMVIERRGEQVSVGAGAACMGNPVHAAVLLADAMVKRGTPLRAGELLLTGALGPLVPVSAGDVLISRIEGLETLELEFAK